MPKYLKLSNLLNVVPEVISLLAISNTLETKILWYVCLLWLICSVILRFIWNSAIIVHGLGHTTAIAFADRELSVFSFTNILEHQNIFAIFKSLLPCHQIYIPALQPILSVIPYLYSRLCRDFCLTCSAYLQI